MNASKRETDQMNTDLTRAGKNPAPVEPLSNCSLNRAAAWKADTHREFALNLIYENIRRISKT